MDAVTFGEFLRRAEERFTAAGAMPEPPEPDIAGMVHELRRVVAGVLGYLRDITPGQHAEAIGLTAGSRWQRAAVDLREALQLAVDSLDYATAGLGERDPGTSDARVRDMADAADALIAGRDLLNSHVSVSKDGTRAARTGWAFVLETPRTAKALTGELARWPRRLALCAEQLASGIVAPPAMDEASRTALNTAGRWLRRADMMFRDPHGHVPDPAGRDLLYGIPLAAPPERAVPKAGEPDAVLCSGIEASAARLRYNAFGLPDRARWSTEISGYAFEQAARASAIACDLVQAALQTLAERPGNLPRLPCRPDHIRATAAAVGLAQHAWRQAADAWRVMATDVANGSPAMTETVDLAIRAGRLVVDDPQWTPARHRSAQLRDNIQLASDSPRFVTILSAFHHATDALARTAHADLAAINAVPGRLYALTRSLPARYNVPRRYAKAPAERVNLLRQVYQIALNATERAARHLDELVLATDAPSRTLALARSAAPIACDTHALDGDDALALCTETLGKNLRPQGDPLGARHRQDIDAQALIRAYAEEGKTLKECANRFGMSTTTMVAILEEHGIARRRPGPADEHEPHPAAADPGGAGTAAYAGADPHLGHGSRPRPGTVTATISALGVNDPSVLVRAAAIDNAADGLVRQAGRESSEPASSGRASRARGRTAANVAAADAPRSAAAPARLTTSKSSARATSPARAAGRARSRGG